MKNIVKNTMYAVAGSAFLALNTVNAIDFGESKVNDNLKGAQDGVDTAAQTLIGNFMTFLGIIAVAYLLWGGFNILTAGGDEEKVKTGKTVIIQAAIGLVVIFLANSIIQWLLTSILGGAA